MSRFVLVLMLGLTSVLAFSGARAAEDPFTVSGITVDATGPAASVAENIAINKGRGRAWTTLYRRLTKSQDWPRQPVLDDLQLQRMVRNYVVSNERRSTTRYVASMTYEFNADAVRRLLRAQNIAYVDMETKPVLVIPMAPGYAARSAWARIWADAKYRNGAVPMLTPVGDMIDAQALAALNFATAQWSDVEPAASRVHATDAFLVQVSGGRGTIAVALRRLGPGGSPPIPNVVVPVRPGVPGAQAYGAAADAAAAAIVDAWKARAAIDFNKRYRLTADARISSLASWGVLMQKLAAVPTITEVSVVAIDTGEARVAIAYVGTQEQLVQTAAQADIELSNGSGAWQLSAGSAPPPQAAQ